MTNGTIYTIGHSTHPIEKFFDLLQQHKISYVVDVRSTPFSQFNPQFNQSSLEASLGNDITYLFMGAEFGVRVDDSSCYEEGKVKYSRLAQRSLFREGINRLCKGSQEHRIALMCAEKEPLECHRTLLVSEALKKEGVSVEHIHSDGRLESHEAVLERLLAQFKLSDSDMFLSKEDRLSKALEMQEERIAYQVDDYDNKRRAV